MYNSEGQFVEWVLPFCISMGFWVAECVFRLGKQRFDLLSYISTLEIFPLLITLLCLTFQGTLHRNFSIISSCQSPLLKLDSQFRIKLPQRLTQHSTQHSRYDRFFIQHLSVCWALQVLSNTNMSGLYGRTFIFLCTHIEIIESHLYKYANIHKYANTQMWNNSPKLI